ncbi:hypothetical protein P167DRAFT_574870 [Morchella conica CCBAS932]|uniref:HECT-type E3 ubiquitin transferase n=1 Tax=Morchella conica CCBAS932 TaxID=1392247 RepID=A0A3N4KRB5_9PEZI|nr:hypothetical protein P167DRAFT_574870 [Morchella conica CCBAS932]
MFTFNGSSRKPRVVNLSGRKSTVPPRGSKPSQSLSLANAQKERAEREAERRQLKAASNIQRVWRGRRVAGIQRAQWRREWDEEFGGEIKGSWIRGIALFIAFNQRGFVVRRDSKGRIGELGSGEGRDGSIKGAKGYRRERIQDPQDFERIKVLVSLVMDAIKNGDNMAGEDPKRSRYLLGQFAKLLVEALYDDPEGADLPGKAMSGDSVRNYSLRLLPWLAERLPTLVDAKYYQALSRVTTACEADLEALLRAVLTPLRSKNECTAVSYTVFAANYLITPGLPERLGAKGFCMLREGVDIEELFKAIEATPGAWLGAEVEGRLWLLAYIIDFLFASSSRKTIIDLRGDDRLRFNRDVEQQRVLSLLLASVSAEAGKRIDIEDMPMGQEEEEDSDEEDSTDIKSRPSKKQPLPPFIKSRLEGLVQQSSVSTVFSKTKYSDLNDAKIFAGFTLTLLLVFPRKSQDVRMWLCLAETSDGASAVRFLWEAVRRTNLYSGISRDYKVAVESLKRRNNSEDSMQTDDDEEWNLILLFVELYGFLLMVMDDDEFFAGRGIKDRQLPLKEVGEMSVFLKSMTFAMYWEGGEIIGEDKSRTSGGEIYFKDQNSKGWSVDYLRAQATALLKQLYTRDSRRQFLPKGHWLMTNHFDMEGFIPSVVQEEENRHRMEADDEDVEEEDERELDPAALAAMNPIERRNLRWERKKRSQRKKQRYNYLAAIAPRLEILKNLPFFIPFATRVQIFRQFVSVDQKRRRGGFVDPDQWRAAVLSRSRRGTIPRQDEALDGHDMLSRHHATIHRNRVFEDAYKQFWPLGERLKEPIQITFVDQFGTEEAGIDGGGVTKEFLTGVCGEAFTPAAAGDRNADDDDDDDIDDDHLEPGEPEGSSGYSIRPKLGKNLFLENEQHLLYPNPTSIEVLKEELATINYPDLDKGIRRLLRRYEFLGRVVGKCLYEGILVDVAFAGFFLLRWSQQASATASVGVNDLRDLDEDLYRGLVNLKNYNGDVEADFALNFTITSRLPSQKTITIELKPGGEKIPVTNTNKLEYIHLVSRYRLSGQAYEQTAAFLKGLNSIIQPSWLSMFNQSELQTLVGGDINTPIDVEDLRRNTIYGGVYQIGDDGKEHPSVQLFWEVMRELDDFERRKVLKFVTSVARAPLLGFGILRPKFSIRDAGEDQSRLCSASTCVNLLKMPRYKDFKILKEKLLYSVNSNAGFDLS